MCLRVVFYELQKRAHLNTAISTDASARLGIIDEGFGLFAKKTWRQLFRGNSEGRPRLHRCEAQWSDEWKWKLARVLCILLTERNMADTDGENMMRSNETSFVYFR